MKSKYIGWLVVACVAIGLFIWWVSSPKEGSRQEDSSKKLSVVTTLFPLYDFAKAIGGEYADVTLLLPPGVESHSFEPKPSDMIRIDQSDIFAYTGKAMEPWVEDLRKGIRPSVAVVDASVGIELMKEAADAESEHETEHAFEWAGAFSLQQGDYRWSFAKVAGEYAESTMKMAVVVSPVEGAPGIEAVEKTGEALLNGMLAETRADSPLVAGRGYQLVFDSSRDETVFTVKIGMPGTYVFFTEHMPTEFEGNEHFFKNAQNEDVETVATEPEEAGHHHHHHGGADPHIWLDFDNAAIMVSSLEKAFLEKDPAHAAVYQKNAEAYRARLAGLDKEYIAGLASCSTRQVVVGGHYAFGYLAHRYGLEYVAAQGFAPDAEPSAKDLALLVDQVKKNNIKFVFYEELTSPKIAEALANETGAKMLLLNAAHNIAKDDYVKGMTFLGIMTENLASLREGLGCK
jgi:ABC-type Zn uptake system ZnuABC Zn-binding protein ZnuA